MELRISKGEWLLAFIINLWQQSSVLFQHALRVDIRRFDILEIPYGADL